MTNESRINRRTFIAGSAAGAGMFAMGENLVGEAGGSPEGKASQGSSRKILISTDVEGLDGVTGDWEDQCDPWKSPRWAETQKILTDEVNVTVDELYAGGASEVLVGDFHDSSRSMSAVPLDPRAVLLQGTGLPPSQGLDNSYAGLVFIGRHAMAGAEGGILSHSFSFNIQNMWLNNRLIGEIGVWAAIGGYFGVPVIMLAGDEAACNEIRSLAPGVECAAVKRGVSRTAGYMLSHSAALRLIRETARRAMSRFAEFRPYKAEQPAEFKVEYTTTGMPRYQPGGHPERLDARTFVWRGKDILEAWRNYRS